MAHALSLTDGVTTISLTDGSNSITLRYAPAAPTVDEKQQTTLSDGGEFSAVNLRNPTETVELMLLASSKTALQSRVQAIETLLIAANRRQRTKVGARIYLQLQVDGEASAWRSEILSGRLELDESGLDMWANIKAKVRLHLTRRYYWEGPETELALSTSNAAAATGGRTIYNHDDAGTGHDNWVQIAVEQVTGTLPAPVKLVLTNNSGAAQGYYRFYIATNAFAAPETFSHILEGESGSGGTTGSDAGSSNGSYLSKTWTGTAYLNWTLSGALLQQVAGRYVRVLMRLSGYATGDFYAQIIVRDADGLIDLFAGDEVRIDNFYLLHDLGAIPLPPSSAVSVSWSNMTLYLRLRAASSTTVQIDFLQLTPLDSYVQLIQRGYEVANGDTITIDGIDDVVHTEGYPIYTPIGMPLLVYPQRPQRLIFLHDEGTGSADIGNTFSVRAYYRPRRTTV